MSETNTIDDFGKSITNDFNITVQNLVVNKDALVKGDLTVLGKITYNELDVEDLVVENATIGNLTLENPLPTSSGGTGLGTIGTAGQVLGVNPTGTGLTYINNTEGSVTSVSALLPLASSGGTTPTISIPSTTGTGSTVVLDNTPSLVGPVLVTGDLNCEDGSVGLLARNTSGGTSASISMNTFSSKSSRIRTSNDVEFRIDNIGSGQRKKMKLMADSVAVTRSELDELDDGFYVDFPTTIRNDTFIRDTYCSSFLNFPQSTAVANQNGIRMYSGTNQDNPRLEIGINSGDFYPSTSSSYFKIADVSGVYSVTLGAGSASFSLGTGNFSVSCAGIGAITTQTIGVGGITISCLGSGAIALTTTTGLLSFTSGNLMTLSATTSIRVSSLTTNFLGYCLFNKNVLVSGLLANTGGASFSKGLTITNGGLTITSGGLTITSGGATIAGTTAITGTLSVTNDATFTKSVDIGTTLSVVGLASFSKAKITSNLDVNGPSTFSGQCTVTGLLEAAEGLKVGGTHGLKVTGTATVSGLMTANAGLKVNSNTGLQVTGPCSVTGLMEAAEGLKVAGTHGLKVTGTATVSGLMEAYAGLKVGGSDTGLQVTGPCKISGATEISNGLKITAKGLDVTGDCNVSGRVKAMSLFIEGNNETKISGPLTVNGLLSANAGLEVSGLKGFKVSGTANVTGKMEIGGKLDVTGKLSTLGGLSVTGISSLGGATSIGGATSVAGALSVTGGATIGGITNIGGALNVTGVVTTQVGVNITGLLSVFGGSLLTGGTQITGILNCTGLTSFTSLVNCFFGLGVTGGVTINTVGQQCDITGGRIKLYSQVDAVSIIAPEGGFNVGSSAAGGVVGHIILETQNGFTQYATGNIDLRTTTKANYTGNGNITMNTLNAYSGDIYIGAKGVFAIGAANEEPSQNGANVEFITFDTSAVSSGGYTFKFPATIGTENSIFLSGGSSSPLSWLAPGAANTFLSSNGTSLSWVTSTSVTNWASPGAIGSALPNTGVFTTLSSIGSIYVNSDSETNQTNVNPALYVFANGLTKYGMDLGWNPISNRFRTRIFAPNPVAGSGDIALSIGSGIGQAGYTDKLIVRGDTGNIEMAGTVSVIESILANSLNVTNTTNLNPGVFVYKDGIGNTYGMDLGFNTTSGRFRTRIIAPTLVDGGDIALSTGTGTTQAGYTDRLIVRGDTGNIEMTAPAVTVSGNLTVSGPISAAPTPLGINMGMDINGWTSIQLNGNANTGGYIDFSTSGVDYNARIISSALSKNLKYEADLHEFKNSTDTVTFFKLNDPSFTAKVYGTLGSTGNLYANSENLLSTTNVNPALYVYVQSVYKYGMDLGYNATSSRYRTRIFAPDPTTGGSGDIALSIGSGTTQEGYTDRLIVRGDTGTIEMNTPRVTVSDILGVSGSLYGNWLNLANTTALNPAIYVFSYLTDSYGMDYGYNLSTARFRTRIFAPTTGDIALSIGSGSNQSDFVDRLIVRGDTGNIEMTAPAVTVSGNLTVSGPIAAAPTPLGINMGIDINGWPQIQLNGNGNTGGYIDFSTSGVDFNTRIISSAINKDFTYIADIHTFNNSAENTTFFKLNDPPYTAKVYGALGVSGGNIYTNQNIIGGISIINNGDLALSVSSPGTILIRGGSGSIITLPDATTLIVGFVYTINNNSNHTATVNRFVSGTVGSVPPLNAATVTCIAIDPLNPNGSWDIHITGPSSGTDWATPGEIGSAVPNTGVFTTLSATGSIYANSTLLANQTNLNPGVFLYQDVIGNTYGMDLGFNATSGRFRTRIIAPTLGDGGDIALSTGYGTTQSASTDRLIVRGDTGTIEMNTPRVTVSDILGVSGSLYGNWLNLANTTALNPAIYVFSYLTDSYGMDYGYNLSTARFRTRIFAPTTGDIALSIGSGSNQSDFVDRLIVRGDTGNIEMTAPAVTVSGNLTVSGPIAAAPTPLGINMGMDINGWTSIQLNGNANTGGYIDFSTSGVDFNTRIISSALSKNLNYEADLHEFKNSTDTVTFFKLNDPSFTAKVYGTLGSTGNLYANSENLLSTTNVNPALYVYGQSVYKYGMDLGYNATSSRYRTRIFAPDPTTGGSGDIALSIGSGTTQAGYTDKLIVRGDTGNIEMVGDVSVTGSISATSFGNISATSLSSSLLSFSTSIQITSNDQSVNIKGYVNTNFSAQKHKFWNNNTTQLAGIIHSGGLPNLPLLGPSQAIYGGLEISQIGTFSTNYCFAGPVGGSSYFIFYAGNYPATNYGSIYWNGANTVYATSSDYRLKKNVEPLQNALEKLNQLKPCTYNMIENNQSSYGFIAHEVQEVIPEIVSGTKDEVDEKGNIVPQQMDYSRFTPYTIAAIQELSKQIQELQKQIALLT